MVDSVAKQADSHQNKMNELEEKLRTQTDELASLRDELHRSKTLNGRLWQACANYVYKPRIINRRASDHVPTWSDRPSTFCPFTVSEVADILIKNSCHDFESVSRGRGNVSRRSGNKNGKGIGCKRPLSQISSNICL